MIYLRFYRLVFIFTVYVSWSKTT